MGMRRILYLLPVLIVLWASPAWAQGAVFLAGHDADDFSPGPTGHAGDPALYAVLFDRMIDCADNGGSGILAIGCDPPPTMAGDWIEDINAFITATAMPPVTYVNGAAAIAALTIADLDDFRIIHVPSDEPDVLSGGITLAEYVALNSIAAEIQAFVNGRGGLFGLTPGEFPDPYGYIAGVGGGVTIMSVPPSGIFPSGDPYDDVTTVIPEGTDLGITDTNLDGCCWHNVFLTFPAFMDALALAEAPNDPAFDQQAAVVGGCRVIVQQMCEPLTQGFWKRQCRGPHPSGEHDKLPDYVDCVNQSLTFSSVFSVDDLCDRMYPDPNNDKCEQAEAQFMALLLNICSNRLTRDCCIDTTLSPATTVDDAVAEIDALLSDPLRTFADCVQAQALADAINTGAALCNSARFAGQEDPLPAKHHTGGACAGVIGAPMPPADIFGTMLPFLALAMILAGMRLFRRRLPAFARAGPGA